MIFDMPLAGVGPDQMSRLSPNRDVNGVEKPRENGGAKPRQISGLGRGFDLVNNAAAMSRVAAKVYPISISAMTSPSFIGPLVDGVLVGWGTGRICQTPSG